MLCGPSPRDLRGGSCPGAGGIPAQARAWGPQDGGNVARSPRRSLLTLRAPRGPLSWRELLFCVLPSFCDNSVRLRVTKQVMSRVGPESRSGSPSLLPWTSVPQSMNHHAGAFRHHLVQDQQHVVLHAPVLHSGQTSLINHPLQAQQRPPRAPQHNGPSSQSL